jgi:hypothetical protein
MRITLVLFILLTPFLSFCQDEGDVEFVVKKKEMPEPRFNRRYVNISKNRKQISSLEFNQRGIAFEFFSDKKGEVRGYDSLRYLIKNDSVYLYGEVANDSIGVNYYGFFRKSDKYGEVLELHYNGYNVNQPTPPRPNIEWGYAPEKDLLLYRKEKE